MKQNRSFLSEDSLYIPYAESFSMNLANLPDRRGLKKISVRLQAGPKFSTCALTDPSSYFLQNSCMKKAALLRFIFRAFLACSVKTLLMCLYPFSRYTGCPQFSFFNRYGFHRVTGGRAKKCLNRHTPIPIPSLPSIAIFLLFCPRHKISI